MAIITRHNLESGAKSKFRDGQANIYKYKAELTILTQSGTIEIKPNNIKAFIVDHDYDTNNMPMIFVTLNIDKNYSDEIVNNQDKNTIIFKISQCILNSSTSNLYTEIIRGEFIYFISSDINKEKDIDYEVKDDNDVWNNIVIGLMSKSLLNANKRVINGVPVGSLSSIIYYIAGHRPLLMEPIQYNVQFSNIHIPTMNSVAKYLRYLNTLQAFYDTFYRYYMDFDISYLLSSSGAVVQRQGEIITDILIKFVNFVDVPMDGLMVDMQNKVYYCEVEGNEVYLSDAHSIDKSYSKIQAVSTDGSSSSDDAVNNLSSYMTTKIDHIRVPNGNTTLLKNKTNSLKTSAIQLSVFVQDVDPSVFTINKKYTIDSNEVYKDGKNYSGSYLLVRKREVYVREDENFTLGVTLSFKKLQ